MLMRLENPEPKTLEEAIQDEFPGERAITEVYARTGVKLNRKMA